MSTALFIVSQEGYWGEECTEPLTALSDAGVEVTVATPSGGPPVIDERSVDPDTVGVGTADRVTEVHETDERLRDPVALADTDPDAHDAVVFPGGHGTEWDVNQDRHARAADERPSKATTGRRWWCVTRSGSSRSPAAPTAASSSPAVA